MNIFYYYHVIAKRWEGTGPKGHGQFPSAYVEELNDSANTTKKAPVEKKVNYILFFIIFYFFI